MKHRDKKTQAAFTLVEVMIAIGIMTVGSLGILAMHRGVGEANRAALEMNTALAITERWIERVERDSLSWTERGPNSLSLGTTDYLTGLTTTTDATGWSTGWFRPTPSRLEESYDFDFFGDDVTGTGNPNPRKYCTNLRVAWLRQGSSARVDIRTFWYREGYAPGGATQHPDWVDGAVFRTADCRAADADGWGLNAATLPPNIDVVFASTVVTWQRRQ